MAFDTQNPKEIKNIDPEGNTWKISLTKMSTKTNRFQLSFFFNEKEFCLSKLQSNRSAEDIWQLLEKLKKTQTAQVLPEPKQAKSRPKKRISP